MEDLISWIKEVADDRSGYPDEHFRRGVELLAERSRNRALVRSFQVGRVTPFLKRSLFSHLYRMAVSTHRVSFGIPREESIKKGRQRRAFGIAGVESIKKGSMTHPEGAPWDTTRQESIKKGSMTPVEWELLPDKLKALEVRKGDKYREASRAFRELSEECFAQVEREQSEEEREKAARLAETVAENFYDIQAVWKEADYYQKHGKILGEHPALQAEETRRKIEEMGLDELRKMRDALKNRIRNYRRDRLPDADPERADRLRARIAVWEDELKGVMDRMEEIKKQKK